MFGAGVAYDEVRYNYI